MLIIFVMSSRQNLSVSEDFDTNFFVFKTLHVIEYATLMLSFVRSLTLSIRYSVKEIILIAGLCSLLYAVSDEIHQTYVPSRTGKVHDLLVDSIGIGLVYYMGMKWSSRIKQYIY